MCDNTQYEVIKDLGIYAITASITLNAGAFGVALSNLEKLNKLQNLKRAFWSFWLGLLFAGIAILITYCIAQMSSFGLGQPSFFPFVLLMTLPTILSFLLFMFGTFILVKNYPKLR